MNPNADTNANANLNEAEPIKPLLKNPTDPDVKPKDKKKKSVVWDWKSLEEQENDRKMNPVLMKIDEPKTPYIPYEEGDDEYLQKLNEVNQIQPTEELLNNVISKLELKPERKDSAEVGNDDDEENCEYIEVDVIQMDGSTKKEMIKKDPKAKQQFLKKRQKAYANEFTQAKMLCGATKDDEDDLMDKTLNNTLINKFSGKITQEMIKKEKEMHQMSNEGNNK